MKYLSLLAYGLFSMTAGVYLEAGSYVLALLYMVVAVISFFTIKMEWDSNV